MDYQPVKCRRGSITPVAMGRTKGSTVTSEACGLTSMSSPTFDMEDVLGELVFFLLLCPPCHATIFIVNERELGVASDRDCGIDLGDGFILRPVRIM